MEQLVGGHDLQLYEFGPNNSTAIYDVSGTTAGISEKLGAPGIYSYQVEGCNPEVCGPRSGFVDVVVEEPPDPPAELFPPPEPVAQDESYTISWNASLRSDTYQFQEKPEGGVWLTIPQASELLSRTLSNNPGVYWYQVRGCHEEGVCSLIWSPPLRVTVKLASTTTYEYDAQGRLVEVKHPNGVVTDYDYDSADNRTSKESSLEN